MTPQDVRPGPFAKLRADLSLRKAFLGYSFAAVAAASLLSFATLLALSAYLQHVYDQSYNGCNSYLYSIVDSALIPAEAKNLSPDEDNFVPVYLPTENSPSHEVAIDDLRGPDYSTFHIFLVSSFIDVAPVAIPTLKPNLSNVEATDALFEEGWGAFAAWMNEHPDSAEVRIYADALGGTPASAGEARTMFAKTFGSNLATPFALWSSSMYTVQDLANRDLAEKTSYLLIVVCFALCFLVAGNRFYKARLAKPVTLLEGAADAIAQQNLDCPVSYQRNDEMGRLVRAFETMRCSLEESQRQLWQTAEDRRRLNTAFAHDLRTPLMVLRGRVEMLEMLARQAEVDQVPAEAVVATCATLRAQIERLEGYVETMSRLQKLEDRTVTRSPITASALIAALEDTAGAIAEESGKTVIVATDPQSLLLSGMDARERTVLALDLPVVLEVVENLLANGARFAKSSVCLTVSLNGGGALLKLRVEDDGPGFSANALAHGCDPFFSEGIVGDESDETKSAESAPNHFGAGLSIASELCSKHGGCLKLVNREGGGASAAATFAAGPTPNCTTADSASLAASATALAPV